VGGAPKHATPVGDSLLTHPIQIFREVHHPVLQPFDGYLLDKLAVGEYRQLTLLSIDPDEYVAAMQLFLNVVGLVAKLEAAVTTQAAFVGFAMHLRQPTVGVDSFGHFGQLRGLGKLETRRPVFAGDRLVGSFEVVVVHVALIDLDGGGQILRKMDEEAFIFEVTVVAFHEGVFVGALRWAHSGLDTQAHQETKHWGREISTGPTAYPTRVSIQPDPLRATMLQEHLCH
jgi:hypothetical protein